MKHQLLTLFVVLAAVSAQAQQTHTALLAIDPGTACEGVGIGTLESDLLRIYPNPASDEVIISGLMGGERIELYEMSGKLEHAVGEIRRDLRLIMQKCLSLPHGDS